MYRLMCWFDIYSSFDKQRPHTVKPNSIRLNILVTTHCLSKDAMLLTAKNVTSNLLIKFFQHTIGPVNDSIMLALKNHIKF
jgi:hypothetical protein